MPDHVILGLGSNMGDSMAILRSAVADLSQIIARPQVSSLYRTKPQDYFDQADFCNLVLAGQYAGSAEELLHAVHRIESAHGRSRIHAIPKGPRVLDIDILHFGDACISTPNLTVPHPAMKKRAFVLIPLLEILPKSADPVTGALYADIFNTLEDQGVMKEEQWQMNK